MADEVLLDLDQLLPPDRKVIINKKEFIVKPITTRELIQMARLEKDLTLMEDAEQMQNMIMEVLSSFIPAFKEPENKEIYFTMEQLKALMEFAQSGQVPESTKGQTTQEKKEDSQNLSPAS